MPHPSYPQRISSLVLALLLVLVSLPACRKKDTAQPTPISNDTTASTGPVIPSTKNLEGEYVWHRTDISSDDVFCDGIKVLNDTTIAFTSDERYRKAWGGEGIYYCYSHKNDSEMIFGDAPYTITYKFKRGVIILLDGSSEYTAIEGASARWKATQDARIGAMRNWHRSCHYFVYNSVLKDTTVSLPDTVADAFGLIGYPSALGHDDLQFSGADSICAFYRQYYIGAGPYKLTTTVTLDYYAGGDSVHLFTTSAGAFPSSARYTSF